MRFSTGSVLGVCALAAALLPLIAYQDSAPATRHVADPFVAGWMLADTNGDSTVDFIQGKIVVPANPTAEQNAAAADLAARLGYSTTGFTPPVVIMAPQDRSDGPRIFVGREAVPARHSAAADEFAKRLDAAEGGIVALDGDIAVLGDGPGLLAAAEAYASRAPLVWRPAGEKLAALAQACTGGQLAGVTYAKGKAGIQRAILSCTGAVAQQDLDAALKTPAFGSVHQLVSGSSVATSTRELPAIPPAPATGAQAGAPDAAPGGGADPEAAGPARLDLATLYTMRGLFRGTPRMPIPSNLDGQLYVPAGAAGVAMANLAARMGLETTGITLPLATPATAATARDIRTKSVVEASTDVGKEAERKLAEENTASGSEPALTDGEGELRIVDKAFGRQPAVLVRGNAPAALGLLTDHFPNLWEPGKAFASVEEVRYDLHRFFSLRSSAGQAAFAMYRLDKWADEVKRSGAAKDVEVKVFVDVADPKLADLVRSRVESRLGAGSVKVQAQSLHAGTQCCEKLPTLHYREPGYTYRQGTPAFQEDVVIPWEGQRLVDAVKSALPKLKPGEPVKLNARVSEGPEQRRILKAQIQELLAKFGAKDPDVQVLCAYKSGVSWLMDEIAPQIKGKASSVKIEFRKNTDAGGTRAMYSPARWVHELYPADEMLSKELGIPLSNITLDQFEGPATGPTYRVHVYGAAGSEILSRDFRAATIEAPYNGVMPEYENVEVDTGWVRLESGKEVLLNKRIPTDIEQFWEHYHKVTLPKVFQTVMATYHGELRPEFAPPFDTLKLDIHMSEPDYELGIDKERISSLEALQEDTFYSTENFVNMMGDLKAGRPLQYAGRIIPIVHASENGADGHVRIEFYAKPAGGPKVELRWTDAQGKKHERTRDMWPLSGAMQPRLVAARARAGEPGPESLTWLLQADFKDDDYEKWVEVEGKDQVERNILSAEQARGQLAYLEQMHSAGLYRDEIAYPYLKRMGFEFDLPLPITAKVDSPAPREYAFVKVSAPVSKRPMIADFAAPLNRPELVQWDEPISPAENTRVLAALAKNPGVSVYWMGRSFLGENIWAADVTLPTPSTLRSWTKETTLKASIVYSGRQHANEVSSTSHILKLGEQLVTDSATRAALKQVNVVLHPITNPDGAELSVQLAEITPNNMLHPGYHGALAADVSVGQTEIDPVYPESRTRRQLLEQWLPDAFLNPHGYPSHEWVQPFSEYSGWVTNRQGANNGRTWWIPRGWFTSLTYLRDDTHPYSPKIAYELRDRIVEAERVVPGLLGLEDRMNARYQRFGQRWQPENMQQPIVNGIRIYMSLKGSAGGGRGGGAAAGGAAGGAAGAAAPGSGGVGGISPDITWDSGYTEAPDETAHGEYMKLMASAGLAFDRVHLDYLSKGKLRINSTT
ncbi:MAG TPA: M14 family zinc carboxypeptidase, partial [Candidatus Acidoferrum sp.]|nr:M14 family zinc carboxypeptidase [Candidatus Acidoferrum sp.]